MKLDFFLFFIRLRASFFLNVCYLVLVQYIVQEFFGLAEAGLTLDAFISDNEARSERARLFEEPLVILLLLLLLLSKVTYLHACILDFLNDNLEEKWLRESQDWN